MSTTASLFCALANASEPRVVSNLFSSCSVCGLCIILSICIVKVHSRLVSGRKQGRFLKGNL